MTDISHGPPLAAARRLAPRGGVRPRRGPWVALYLLVLIGAGAGYAAGRSLGAASAVEPSLALLLRFMGGVKLLAVLGAAAAVQWRATHPLAPRCRLAYLVALAVMAPAPGLILSLGAVGAGALAFHLGMFVFLLVAWQDDALPLRRHAASVRAPAPSAGSRAAP